MEPLRVGQRFPENQAAAVNGVKMRIPDDLLGHPAVLIFYRGHWCSHCRQQLADFQHNKAEFDEFDTRIVALSADTEAEANGTVEQLGLRFPVLYGLDPEAMSRAIGSYTGVRQGRMHVQPAAFVLGRDGTIVHAVYSSGKVGRLTAGDALTILRDLRQAKSKGGVAA